MKQLKSASVVVVCQILLIFSGIILTDHALAQSQATTGQIQGTILDESGATIGGTNVTIKNTETGFSRSLTTDEGGRYNAPLLPLGKYVVTVTQSGFKDQSQTLELRLGSTVTVDFKLAVQVESEVVEVTSGAVIEQSRTETGRSVNEKTISDLPINGRRFLEFATLTPQVQIEPERGGISISGQRGINNNINIDGADFNNPFFGGSRGGERSGSTFTISQEAIREFQVVRAGYSAEFGRSTGGVINAVTKSGTNNFHGSLFYLNRHEQLSRLNALGLPATPTQQQFGGSIGGPIKKDKLFFFMAYDQQLNNAPLTVRFGNLLTAPLPTELLALQGNFKQTNNVKAILGRIDYAINSSNSLSTRYNFSTNTAENGTNGSGTISRAIDNNGLEKDRTNTLVSTLTTIFTPTLLNELRFQYSREDRPRQSNADTPEVNIFSGVGTFGGRAFLPIEQFDDRYQIADNMTYVSGRSTLKFGFDYNRAFVDQTFRSDARGVYNFNTLQNFIDRKPDQYRQFVGSGKFAAAQQELAFYVQEQFKLFSNLTISPGFRYEATFQPQPTEPNPLLPQSAKVNSDFKQFQPRLGISWDPFKNAKTVIRLSGGLFNARTPLLLLNQAFTNNGNPAVSTSLFLGSNGAIASAQKLIPGFTFPNVLTEEQIRLITKSLPQGKPTVAFFDPGFRNPRALQWNASFEHEVMPKLVIGAEFSYIKVVHLERLRDINLADPKNNQVGRSVFSSPRPDPRFSVMRSQESSANSLYRAISFSATSRLSRRIQLLSFYTLAYNYDDDSNERNFSGLQYENASNLRNEYSYAASDVRHSFTTSGVFDLPYGFTVSGIVNIRSGRPFSPTTNTDSITRTLSDLPSDAIFGNPKDVITAGGNGDGQNTDRPIVNGSPLKRNSFRQPNFYNMDLRILKSFHLFGEGRKLQLSAEFFNLFNAKNITFGAGQQVFGPGDVFNITQNRLITSSGTPQNSTFMSKTDPKTGKLLVNNGIGNPFQMQIGARFTF